MDRVGGKVLHEVIPDRVHGRLNRGFKELWLGYRCQFINSVGLCLPGQCNLPALIPTLDPLPLGELNLIY